ncbi:MAG TPA: Mur ligase family protein [Candidatus Woesebacteria bacterium]|nr:Mur ligase family protein [Candidatus Woesebacteria bacterium]
MNNLKKKLAPFVLSYLRFFAKLQLKKNSQAKIIGITGSAGKTSCQSAVLAALGKNKARFKIKVSHKANSESGIPLDILGLRVKNYSPLDWLRLLLLAPWQLLTNWHQFDLYIIEMGIDSPLPPKNMDYLLSIVQPQIAIILNAKAIHSANFDQLLNETEQKQREQNETEQKQREQAVIRLIAAEKSKLAQALPSSGLAIINRDDPAIWECSRQTQAEILTFGTAGGDAEHELDLKLIDWQVNLAGSHFIFEIRNHLKKYNSGSRLLELNLKNLVLGKHYSAALASAILLAFKLGLKKNEIKNNLEKYWTLEPGRSSLLVGKNNSYLLDSSYNASGMLEMIELTQQLISNDQHIKRALAIIGDIRELGAETQAIHQEVAQALAESFSEVYLVGPLMENYALPILQDKIKNGAGQIKQVKTYLDSQSAGKDLAKNLAAGDLVLVKGSQNTIFLEEAVALLLAEEKSAKKVLCRQSEYWLKLKKAETKQNGN